MKKNTLFCLMIAGFVLVSQNACAGSPGSKKGHAVNPVPSKKSSSAITGRQKGVHNLRQSSIVPEKKVEYGRMLTWDELAQKLKSDGLDGSYVDSVFTALPPSPSLRPMGTKIKELYSNRFLPKKSRHKVTPFETELGIPGPWFKGVVNEKNARSCRSYIEENAAAFANAELQSGVPQEVAAALLFVETRLGGYLGEHNAFYNLASMSVSRDPFAFSSYLDKLPEAYSRLDWIQAKMDGKADWAYSELKALLLYCHANNADPLLISGSIYGAIGLCQFMPSNIPKRAMDGDGDGKIDLFAAPDAVASLSNYLRKSGWREDIDLQHKIKVLRSYNAMDIYARTILALAETIRRLDDIYPEEEEGTEQKDDA